MVPTFLTIHFFLAFPVLPSVLAQIPPIYVYANDFVDPDVILAGNFGDYTQKAQQTVILWAETFALDGPWSVLNKTANILPPSGDKHDYLSWAPYWWPNCTGIANANSLTDTQSTYMVPQFQLSEYHAAQLAQCAFVAVWTTCPYINKDGQFNPDRLLVNDTGHFGAMAEAVLYNTIAWTLKSTTSAQKATFENNAVRFLRTWYLDDETAMNPNLNYAQMIRGPGSVIGAHTGVLDLKCTSKVASAILMLREGGSTAWTSELDAKMIAWSTKQISWLETAKIAIEERDAKNNHGSFYFNQLAALKLIINDRAGAVAATDDFFNGIYQNQIVAGGEQPEEAIRTHPFHYRNYNLAAMVVNARIAAYASGSKAIWQKRTKTGAIIKDAVDFVMTVSPEKSDEEGAIAEIYQNLAVAASIYGDTDGKYLAYMKKSLPTFISQPLILWNAPFGSGEALGKISTGTTVTSVVAAGKSPGTTASGAVATGKSNTNTPSSTEDSAATKNSAYGILFAIVVCLTSTHYL